MSRQATVAIGRAAPANLERDGFKCFCGEWFPDRARFDEHLQSHPGRFTVCGCCKRILPEGFWTLDENHNFVSTDRLAERPQETPGSRSA